MRITRENGGWAGLSALSHDHESREINEIGWADGDFRARPHGFADF